MAIDKSLAQAPSGLDSLMADEPALEIEIENPESVAIGVDGEPLLEIEAGVDEDADLPVAAADHEHRAASDHPAAIVTGSGHLAVMADVKPGPAEDSFLFQRVDFPRGQRRTMHAKASGFRVVDHQTG